MVGRVLKVLLGIQVVMLVFSGFVEIVNIERTTLFVRGTINKSIESSCRYFAQETYKNDQGEFVGNNVSDLSFSDRDGGGVAVSGRFFNGSTQEEVYKNLYSTEDFKKFLDGDSYEFIGSLETEKTNKQGLWVALDALSKYYATANGWNIKQGTLSDKYYKVGSTLAGAKTTVINAGVTYLDKETLNNIIKWNMVANFYKGNEEALHKSKYTGGNADKYDYVMYNGFKLFYNTAEVNNITYTVYDLSTEKGKNAFKSVSFIGDGDYWDADRGSGDDYRYICVATVTYTMRMGYDGVTYLKPFMKYLFSRNARVLGRSDGSRVEDYSQYNIDMDTDNYGYLNTDTDLQYDEDGYSLASFNNVVRYYVTQ